MEPTIKELLSEQGKIWEEFKTKNNELIEQKAKGVVDGLLKEHVEKMNKALDEVQGKIDAAVNAGEQAQLLMKRRLESDMVVERKAMSRDDKVYEKFSAQFYKGVDQSKRGLIREAMNAYLSGGKEAMTPEQKHAMSSYSDPSGGYAVIPELDREITRVINESSPIRQAARVRPTSTDQYEKLQRVGRPGTRWRNRETPGAVDTTPPTYNKIKIEVEDLEARPVIPVNLLNDAFLDIESEVRDSVAEEVVLVENSAFVIGDGVGMPKGFLGYPAGTSWGQIQQVNSGSGSLLTPDGIVDLMTALKSPYRARARFVANRTTIGAIRKFKDSTGQYLWQPMYAAGQPQSILGYPLEEWNDMPNVAGGTLPLAFGDFYAGYIVLDRLGLSVLVDPFTQKGFIEYYTTKRVGGGVDNFEAIKIQKIA